MRRGSRASLLFERLIASCASLLLRLLVQLVATLLTSPECDIHSTKYLVSIEDIASLIRFMVGGVKTRGYPRANSKINLGNCGAASILSRASFHKRSRKDIISRQNLGRVAVLDWQG